MSPNIAQLGKRWGTSCMDAMKEFPRISGCENGKFPWKIRDILFLGFESLSECVSHSVVSDSLRPHGPPIRLLCSWNSPVENTGVGSLSLLQGIFPTQGSNPSLPQCRKILYHLSHQGSPESYFMRILIYWGMHFNNYSLSIWDNCCIYGDLLINKAWIILLKSLI